MLDEADRMLEEAFKDQMNELIRLCAPNRQTLLFSATMTDQVSPSHRLLAKCPTHRWARVMIVELTGDVGLLMVQLSKTHELRFDSWRGFYLWG